jgi:hypothetical protein
MDFADLAAWAGDVAAFGAETGTAVVRSGAAVRLSGFMLKCCVAGADESAGYSV